MNDFNTELVGANKIADALKDNGAKDLRGTLVMIPFENLVILDDLNVREHDADWHARVREIADDMKEVGWRKSKPAEIFVDASSRFIITDAHTRHAAAILARSEGATNLDMIPGILLDKGTSGKDITIGLHKNNNGAKLSPLGLSILVKRLVHNHRDSPAEAAKELGMSPKYAGQLLLLAGAPDSIRQMIIEGKVSATHAIQMLEEHGAEAARMLEEGLTKAKGKGKTVVRKKDTLTKEDRLIKAQKKHASTLYQLCDLLLEDTLTDDKRKDVMKKLENVMLQIDQDADKGETGDDDGDE